MAVSANKPVTAYLIIVLGVILAVAAAVEPFYNDSYQLRVGVLLSGLLPYLVYAIVVFMLRRTVTVVAGCVLLAAHAWLVMSERFSGAVNYSDGMIYYVPVLLALAMTPLLIMAMRQPWR